MSPSNTPQRREIWLFDPNPTLGREICKKRPAVVVSENDFNKCGRELIIVVPCSTTNRNYPTHVELLPQNSSLKKVTYAMCEHVRSVSDLRLERRIGYVKSEDDMRAIEDRISTLIGLR
jgi:mRNA interferase MazF